MPELPEVETVKEVLKSKLMELEIKEVLIYYDKMIKTSDVTDFKAKLRGQKFVDIKRRGKYLIFELTDYYLLSHLRMEGKFFYGDAAEIRDKHVHAEFLLCSGVRLKYEDVRKFGTFHLYEKETELEKTLSLSMLGPEPWAAEFNVNAVMAFMKGKRIPIKSMLLSQKVVAGLGNIYVDEVLFAAKVHPMKKSCDLTRIEIENVVHYTRDILSRAIAHKGTTISTFSSNHGISGAFQNFLQVHTKKDEPCPRCAAQILKIKVGGRGTYFCPICQPKPSVPAPAPVPESKMRIIGLTGGIATGKSSVSRILGQLGFYIIDADAIVHELQSVGSPFLEKIVTEFGEAILYADGSLNRNLLGQLIFNDASARKQLEAIMHPVVRTEFEQRISVAKAAKYDVVFLDVPLLFEAGFDDLTTANLVISASQENQLQRLIRRDGLEASQAQARIESQMAVSEKVARGDFVIENNGSLYELEQKIDRFLRIVKGQW